MRQDDQDPSPHDRITLAGSGHMVLGNSLGNRAYGNAGSSVTNAAGHTIRGAGQIGIARLQLGPALAVGDHALLLTSAFCHSVPAWGPPALMQVKPPKKRTASHGAARPLCCAPQPPEERRWTSDP